MISSIEKIQIINNRLTILEDMINSCNQDMARILDGMADPDYNIEECSILLDSLSDKKRALLTEKQTLIDSIPVV
jgi:hypothetical protein